jgi:hypothetical protein
MSGIEEAEGGMQRVESVTINKEPRMPRRRGMFRRLDKIEKEMGYCEIKLEKERRLRKQILFLENDLAAIDGLIGEFSRRGFLDLPLNGKFDIERSRKTARERFLAAGLLELYRDEREILGRERDELLARLRNFSGFDSKRVNLEEEKRKALKNISPAHSVKLRKINDDFKRIEKSWNSFSEDLINLDEGIFFIDRNLDYLKSARTFLISAKGSFDIESWVSTGYLSDLFRHSNIARAKEMADGADRNLKMAQKALVCLASVKANAEGFQRVLVPFLDALFEDIFVESRLMDTLQVVEATLANNLKLAEAIKAKRAALEAKLIEAEKMRAQMFTRLGENRTSRLIG